MTRGSDGKPVGPSKVFREVTHLLMESLDYESALARRSILGNLMSNAVKYTSTGRIDISMTPTRRATPRGRARGSASR